MKLIVGLGNPGKRYEKTRHNAGFLVLDELARDYHISGWSLSKKFNAELAEGTIGTTKVLFAKPMTFMNHSGQAIGLITKHYKLTPHDDIVVIHDEKDIPLGTIKVQKNRGPAGHNGIISLIEHLGTQDFLRIRIGIAPDPARRTEDTAQFVLGKFGVFERRALKKMAKDAEAHITPWLA